jgi:two-component system CheB/CheR fusion protein
MKEAKIKRDKKSEVTARSRNAGQSNKSEPFLIVGIGASAGGLEAVSELLHHLPEKTGMAFVLVQHLDPTHGSVLGEILSRTTKIPVVEVTEGAAVDPDHIYVMPANTSMVLETGKLRLSPRVISRGQHMPINYFFHSLADERGERAIGVILSGTASDGTEGCTAIKAAGGITFAQDEKSAKYSSMPRSAVSAGCVDFVLPPKQIAQELTRIGRHPYIARPHASKEGSPALGSDFGALFSLVHQFTGVDFTHYKQTTLQRRIKRRMILHKFEKLKDYLTYIKKTPGELDELYRDILIHVTGFFRDSEAFEALRATVFPKLLQDREPADTPIRIWVPGCSTGEEVYSIAIVLLEYLWEHGRHGPLASTTSREVQIFATDLSETALDRARNGLYAEAAVSEVSAERLKQFFVRLNGGYQINKSIRDMCIFAKQNVASDPPFSNLDLISCRNLLIYLGPVLQKRVIPTLHYALKPGGYLMLGESESLGTFSDHFLLVERKHKIYQKRTGARLLTYFTGVDYAVRNPGQRRPPKASETGFTIEKEVEQILSERFVPASIVVNDAMEIVQFRGKTGAYLEPPAGPPSFSLSKMVREGLLVDLRTALSAAKKGNATVRKEGVRIQSNGGTREINLEVIPVRRGTSHERFYIVVFQDSVHGARPGSASKHRGQKAVRQDSLSAHGRALAREVVQLREQLRSIIEERDTTAEEFKSANEEVLSANEELQSTNEELETAKEELQSSNEELTTLNEELHNRNTELSAVNNDLVNLLGSINIPVIMVGNDLRIRRFTTPAEKVLNVIPGDIGRRLGEIRPNVNVEDLEQIVRETLESATLHESEIREKGGGWYLMRVRPYKTWESKIDGAVITFQDIDALKRTVEQARNYAEALIETARESILVLDADLRVAVANRPFYRTFQVSAEETEHRMIYDLGNGQWNIPSLRELLDDIVKGNVRIDDFEVKHDFPHLGTRIMLLNARRLEPHPRLPLILLSIEDVTEKRRHLEALRRQDALLELAHETIIVRELNGTILFWNRGAEEIYGWTKEQAIGKTTHELLKTEFPKPWNEVESELLRKGHWEGELTHVGRDRHRIVVESRWVLLREESGGAVVLEINSDITARRRSEEELRQLSGYLMRVQDEERRRIARELHDSTGQKLIALKMGLESVSKQSNVDSRVRTSADECLKLVDETTEEIRTLAQVLHPPLLDEGGLRSATRWLVDGFSNRSGIAVDLVLSPQLDRLPQHIEIALFRVIQESLNNIHRHAAAKKARIEIAQTVDAVSLHVSDDGKGIRPGLVPGSAALGSKPVVGVGILGMKERLSQLGGRLEITSSDKGTTIRAVVPNHRSAA